MNEKEMPQIKTLKLTLGREFSCNVPTSLKEWSE